MSGQALNRGGVRVDFNADAPSRDFVWSVKMRNHQGLGATADAAFAALIEDIEAELANAHRARETYAVRSEPPRTTSPGEAR